MSHEPGSQLDKNLVGGVPSDTQIEVAVKDALTWEDRIDAGRIRVKVATGEVILSGEVDTLEQKELAETLASGVRGVSDVDNQLKVLELKSESGTQETRE